MAAALPDWDHRPVTPAAAPEQRTKPLVGASAGAPAVAVRLQGVSKSFGAIAAVRDVSLALREGSLTSLLGPSGCGKTTLLRLIAGLESVSAGEIEIKGRAVGKLAIHKRNIGMVFQNYALFPHKTVGDNIAFGLKHRGVDAAMRAQKVRRALDIVRLPGIEERYPNQLSGGQQQRVALARAVVFEPDVLLLDEPLSALDANLREEMRTEIKLIQKALGLTSILVTHDQQEALAMSDEVVVMNQGMVQQCGDPKTIYRFPRNRFVAGFLGQANVWVCDVLHESDEHPGQWLLRLPNGCELKGVPGGPEEGRPKVTGGKADLVIRGSDLIVEPLCRASGRADVNSFTGTVIDASYLGDDAHYLIEAAGLKLRAACRIIRAGSGPEAQILQAGMEVSISVLPEACAILPAS